MKKHYVSVKTDVSTLKQFEVDEPVQRYIVQLEHALIDERVKDTLHELYPRLAELTPRDETEYLMSSKLNAKKMEESIKAFEHHVDQLHQQCEKAGREDVITPVDLLDLGFKEEYQEAEKIGEEYVSSGYIYYSYYTKCRQLLSTSVDDEEGFYVFLDDDTEVRSISKLVAFINAVNALESID